MEPRQYAVMASNMEYHILEMMLSDNSLNMLYDMKVLMTFRMMIMKRKMMIPAENLNSVQFMSCYFILLEKMEGDR